MSSYSPPKPHVRRERARFEELERVSRGELRDRPNHRKSGSGSASGSTSSSSPEARGSPQQRQQTSTSPSTAATTTTETTPTYPNYYDYSENTEIISPAKQREQQQQQQQQQVLQTPPRNNVANMAMQVPIQPYSQQPSQQPHSPSRHSSNSAAAAAAATPRQGPGPTNLTTAQLQQAVARGDSFHSNKPNSSSNAANTNGHRTSSTGNRPLSLASSTGGPRSPAEDIFPPNKVDLDAARFRHAQQAQSRRERGSTTSDRDRPPPLTKDPRDSRRPSQSNGRPASMNMGLPHLHNGGRPASPESLLTPTGHGHNIIRLSTPSIPNSVLQPLDAKVVEYGSLMTEAQGEMARLDEEMRLLQDRQREAEQRFLEAKAKHDDYRRQYNDVERALRGDFASVHGHGRDRRDPRDLDDDANAGSVPPAPSMPNLQQYGVDSRQGSGMALNNNQGHPGMRSQRTVSIQSDMDGDMSRPGSKRGRFSRLFGV